MRIGNKTRREVLIGAMAAAGSLALGSTRHSTTASSTSPDEAHGKNAAAGTADQVQARMRGLMVDAGRVPETMAYYRRLIEFCSEWHLNTLQFRLTDDQGSAMRFTSVPGLVTHGNAFTPDELKSLADYGETNGVQLIPELESFGHTGFITRSPRYAHLLDRDATSNSAEFTGIIPVAPESLEIFEKLYREVAEVFPSVYLHGGCDEVNWGGSALSRKALQTKSRVEIWAEYLNTLNHISVRLGKQFIVWGDLVLRKEPEILGKLDKSIIVMDWSYYENSSASVHQAFAKISANGSRAIGAPALSCYKWGARVGTEQLRDIDAFADVYFTPDEPASLGVIVTNWIPSRYVQCSIWDGFAYAAVAFQEGTATAQTSGFRRFVERHYGATWNEVWGEVFQMIYDTAPYVKDKETASWMGLSLVVPWSSDTELVALLKAAAIPANPFIRIRSLLVELEPLVIKNLSDFKAFALCVEYLEKSTWREAVLIEHVFHKPMQPETAKMLIETIAESDRSLAEALKTDWDHGRFPNADARRETVYDLQAKDQLLFQWSRAAAYSSELAKNPDHFAHILASAVALKNAAA